MLWDEAGTDDVFLTSVSHSTFAETSNWFSRPENRVYKMPEAEIWAGRIVGRGQHAIPPVEDHQIASMVRGLTQSDRMGYKSDRMGYKYGILLCKR